MAPEQAAGRVRDIGPATDVYAPGDPALRAADRPAAVQGRVVERDDPASPERRATGAAPIAARRAAGPGDDLPQVPGEGAGRTICQCAGNWPMNWSDSSPGIPSRLCRSGRTNASRGWRRATATRSPAKSAAGRGASSIAPSTARSSSRSCSRCSRGARARARNGRPGSGAVARSGPRSATRTSSR